MSITLEENHNNVYRIQPNIAIPRTWHSWFIGRPLHTADAPHQTIGKLVGLAVFASDTLSSTAYATQEILMVLAIAGSAALGYSIPIAMAIIALMLIVSISYEQTIHAYPGGGGAYIVARDNLGELPAQTAGAALLTDYILTVAVSVSSGVAQIVSAFPVLFEYRVWLAVGLVGFVMLINLRGGERVGHHLRHTDLLLHRDHATHGRGWLIPLPDRQPGVGGQPAGIITPHRGRPDISNAILAAARICKRNHGADRDRGDI
jgi:hypothetical protein